MYYLPSLKFKLTLVTSYLLVKQLLIVILSMENVYVIRPIIMAIHVNL